jgi:Domain of unknown function (DUF4922)
VNWERKIVTDRELEAYRGDEDDPTLEARVAALIDQQYDAWPLLRAGVDAFAKIETKRVRLEEAEVVVQHNPGRIRSTAAEVDEASVEARRCFLCPDGLPVEEKGIAYGDDLVILCNPFPVLERHLSIVHREHVPQQIDDNVETLLSLARDLGSTYFVLYNGPECGASAPDHLHFQACARELLPIEKNLYDDEPVLAEDCSYCEETAQSMFELFTLGGCGRSVVVFRGGNREEVAKWVYEVIKELALQADKREPLINMVCTYDPRLWTVYLFPRAKHRPACFYAEGEQRIIISPGAIDMAGVVVVPDLEHFEKIDGPRIAAIFSEVSLSIELVNDLVDGICSTPGSEERGW